MVTTVILSMLCLHLLCFSVMFLLISTRLDDKTKGMDVFALGNLLLGLAYILQLSANDADQGFSSLVNHTLTLCAPTAYLLGAIRFFGRPAPVLYPLLLIAGVYTLLQLLVQLTLGSVARHAMLAGACASLFLGMALAALYIRRGIAKDLRVEMLVFAILIGGICLLNAAKLVMVLHGGMQALSLNSSFQTVFYLYMSFLGTVLPPCAVWLVLRRLTHELRGMAAHDPLTHLLNRRGLIDSLAAHFRSRSASNAYLLIIDIDHFKLINDNHGHKVGDHVLCHVASLISASARKGDLICRLGGEEFVVICLGTDQAGALRLAERIRFAIESSAVHEPSLKQPIGCTITIGVSQAFSDADALDALMQQADAALYRGKTAGRNRVEWADPMLASSPI